jgi:glucokinase
MILAGDIGGTHARLAVFDVTEGRLQLVASSAFPSQQFAGLDDIVVQFVKSAGIQPTLACFGIAGPVTKGRVEASNLPWVVESARLAQELKLSSVQLINDLEATGWGIGALSSSDVVPLNNVVSKEPGNQAVIAAGTGLGEGGLYWDGKRHHVFASEGGHCDFAPLDDLQLDLVEYLRKRYGHVSYERVLSGPGLVNVFDFLRDTGKGTPPDWLIAELAGKCSICEQALEIFAAVFGAEAGNLALKLKATGGVFLAGGIAPKLLPKLTTPTFMDAFLSKGRLRRLMEIIPVQVIMNDQLALLGAARCALFEPSA